MDLIQINFEDFHAANPMVYALWDRFTRELIAAGFQTGSAAMVAERIRWETGVVTTHAKVKINNNYTSRYARLWEQKNPAHEGYFRKRMLHTPNRDSVNVPEAEA